jgi:hypothetical protein
VLFAARTTPARAHARSMLRTAPAFARLGRLSAGARAGSAAAVVMVRARERVRGRRRRGSSGPRRSCRTGCGGASSASRSSPSAPPRSVTRRALACTRVHMHAPGLRAHTHARSSMPTHTCAGSSHAPTPHAHTRTQSRPPDGRECALACVRAWVCVHPRAYLRANACACARMRGCARCVRAADGCARARCVRVQAVLFIVAMASTKRFGRC